VGDAVCFYPSDTSNCYPGFFETTIDMGGISNDIGSIEPGCFGIGKKMAVPSNGFSHGHSPSGGMVVHKGEAKKKVNMNLL